MFPAKPTETDVINKMLKVQQERRDFDPELHFANMPARLTISQIATLSPLFAQKARDYFARFIGLPSKRAGGFVMSGWYLPVEIEGQVLAAMIDTGSVITLMGEKCVKQLGVTPESCEPITMTLADDSSSQIKHRLKDIVISIGNFQIPANILVVPNVAYDLILGRDFLEYIGSRLILTKPASITIGWQGRARTFPLHDKADCIGLATKLDITGCQNGQVIKQDSQYIRAQEKERKRCLLAYSGDQGADGGEQEEQKQKHSCASGSPEITASEEAESPSRTQRIDPRVQESRGRPTEKQVATGTRGLWKSGVSRAGRALSGASSKLTGFIARASKAAFHASSTASSLGVQESASEWPPWSNMNPDEEGITAVLQTGAEESTSTEGTDCSFC